MIPPYAEFADLIQLARQGDEDAVQQLLDVYGEHIFRVVRRNLQRRLRRQFDSADIVQDVWASFFAGSKRHRTFNSPEELVRALVSMARNKIVDTTRKRLGRRRTSAHEVPLEEVSSKDLPLAKGSPSQHLKDQEAWIAFLRAQPPVHRAVFTLFRSGKGPAEISEELGLTYGIVARILRKILTGSSI